MMRSVNTVIKPRLGDAMSLGVSWVDAATLVLTFHYQELVEQVGIWQTVERQQVLVEGQHYSIDEAKGQITLLVDPFWQQEGYWRSAPYERHGEIIDQPESLLYKGSVKYPQYIEADFDYWHPSSVIISLDKTQIAGDGADEATVTVTCDDPSVSEVPVAITKTGQKIGTMMLPVGEQAITAQVVGRYDLDPDHDDKDAHGRSRFTRGPEAPVSYLEVV